MIQADLLKPYLGPALRSWISDGEETSTPVVSRAGGAEEIEPVITSGPLLAKARGGKPSGSVARMPLDLMLEVQGSPRVMIANCYREHAPFGPAFRGFSVSAFRSLHVSFEQDIAYPPTPPLAVLFIDLSPASRSASQ